MSEFPWDLDFDVVALRVSEEASKRYSFYIESYYTERFGIFPDPDKVNCRLHVMLCEIDHCMFMVMPW